MGHQAPRTMYRHRYQVPLPAPGPVPRTSFGECTACAEGAWFVAVVQVPGTGTGVGTGTGEDMQGKLERGEKRGASAPLVGSRTQAPGRVHGATKDPIPPRPDACGPWDWQPAEPWTCPRCGRQTKTRLAAPVCRFCLFSEGLT